MCFKTTNLPQYRQLCPLQFWLKKKKSWYFLVVNEVTSFQSLIICAEQLSNYLEHRKEVTKINNYFVFGISWAHNLRWRKSMSTFTYEKSQEKPVKCRENHRGWQKGPPHSSISDTLALPLSISHSNKTWKKAAINLKRNICVCTLTLRKESKCLGSPQSWDR